MDNSWLHLFQRTLDNHWFLFSALSKCTKLKTSNSVHLFFLNYCSPDTAKTSLSMTISIEENSNRIITNFIGTSEIVRRLPTAYRYNRKKMLNTGRSLINFVRGENMLFQLINKQCETKFPILTTYVELSQWDTTLPWTIANAILDTLVHHSTVHKITGKS